MNYQVTVDVVQQRTEDVEAESVVGAVEKALLRVRAELGRSSGVEVTRVDDWAGNTWTWNSGADSWDHTREAF